MRNLTLGFFLPATFVLIFGLVDQISGAPAPPLIDTHTHLFSPVAARLLGEQAVSADTIISQLDKAGISRAAIFSDAYFFEDRETAEKENNFLASEAAKYPSRLIGFCSVPIKAVWAIEEIERCGKTLKLRGLKLHPQANDIDLRNPDSISLISPILNKAGELGLPVVFDSVWLDSRITLEMVKIVLNSPKTKVIFAHAFFKDYRDLSIPALLYKMNPAIPRNLYVDLSATSVFFSDSPERENLIWHLRQFGTDRILMGSDYPAFTPSETLSAIKKLPLSKDELSAITGGNAAAIF